MAFAVVCGTSLQNASVTDRARRVLEYGNTGNWPIILDERSVRRIFNEGQERIAASHVPLFSVLKDNLFE
jgi:hypothetical protein